MPLARTGVEVRADHVELKGDLDKVFQAFEHTSKRIEGVHKTLAQGFKTVMVVSGLESAKLIGEAFEGLKRKIEHVFEGFAGLAEIGHQANVVAESFESLGGKAEAINKAKAATLGMVGAFDLMKIANEAFLRGLPNVNENLGLIADVGTRLGESMGKTAKEGVENLALALEKGTPKALKMAGVAIDTDRAYRSYAKSVNEAAGAEVAHADKLSKLQQTQAIQMEGLKRLHELQKTLPAVLDSSAIAITALETSWKDLRIAVGRYLDESPELTKAVRELQKFIDGIDTEKFSAAMAAMGANVLTLGQEILDFVVHAKQNLLELEVFAASLSKTGKDMASSWGDLFHPGRAFDRNVGEMQKMADDVMKAWDISRFQGGLKELHDALLENTLGPTQLTRAEVQRLSAAFASLESQAKKNKDISAAYGKDLKDVGEQLHAVEEQLPKVKKAHTDMAEGSLKEEKAIQAEIKKTIEAVTKLKEGIARKTLEESLKIDIKSQDFSKFQTDLAKLTAVEEEANTKVINDALRLKKLSEQEAADIRKSLADEFNQKYWDEYKARGDEVQKKLAEEQKKAFQDAVDFWSQIFDDAINGTTADLGKAMQKVAISFAASVAASLLKLPDFVKGPGSLGQWLASQAFPGMVPNVLGSVGASPFGVSGVGPVADGSLYAAMLGSGGTSGIGPVASGDAYAAMLSGGSGAGGFAAAAGPLAMGAGGLYMGYQGYQSGNHLQGVAGGAMAGAAIGSVVPGIGTLIGAGVGAGVGLAASFFGGHKPEADHQARIDFGKWVNDFLAKQPFQTTGGSLISSFNIDNAQFNKPGWADANAAKFGAANSGMFSVYGEAIKGLLGITRDVGPQIGKILQDNLSGNLEDAKLLMMQLGISEKQLDDILLQAGEKGQKSWQEVIHQMNLAHQGFEVGIAGTAKMKEAFDEIVSSGGRGMAAIKGVKDSFQEAKEAGVSSFSAWKQMLISKGISEGDASIITTAAKNTGIKKWSDFLNADDLTIGKMIANMADLGLKFSDVAKAAGTVGEQFGKIPENQQSNLHFDVTTNLDPNTQAAMQAGVFGTQTGNVQGPPTQTAEAHALGGIVTSPTFFRAGSSLHVMGEGGPEAIMPVVRGADGRYGIRAHGKGRGDVHIHIDATGATPGVEQDILQAMEAFTDQAVQRAVSAIVEGGQRGGSSIFE